jgi:hypothetical protein
MVDRVRVDSFRYSEDIDDNLRNIERNFQPGEYGEVVFKVNAQLASTAGREALQDSVNALDGELRSEGMQAWPSENLVSLDWANKKISIRFVQTSRPSSLYQTPSYIGIAIMGARAGAAAAPVIARGGFLRWMIGLARSAGAKFRSIGSRLTRSNAIALAGTGLLVWSMIDLGSLVEVFKWAGRQVGGLLKDALGLPLLIGIGAVGVGLVLVSRGK